MKKEDRENWITNIENIADYIASELGEEAVRSVIYKYGAVSIYEIASSELPEIFSELYAIEADLRSE